METIYALASARGKAGVAVVRISGPKAFSAAKTFCQSLSETRLPVLRKLYGFDGSLLDEALVLSFNVGQSFTGEETVEFQTHGSIATVNALLENLSEHPDLRLAEPGEFTRRALENDKLDLAQVEGLSDLLEAETEAQRKQALRVFSGELGNRADFWRTTLIRAVSLLEVTIDFADEDVPVDVTPEVLELANLVLVDLRSEAEGVKIAERIREGFEVAIVGPPNAGKSTLLNALAGRDAAITSEFAGTTRDVIEVRMDLNGLPVTVLDTAGIRETTDDIEKIGVQRAQDRANAADIRVFLTEKMAAFGDVRAQVGDIFRTPKADQSQSSDMGISGKTGLGVRALIDEVSSILEQRSASAGIAIRERHRISILNAINSLEYAVSEVEYGMERAEIASEEFRTAIRALDSLIGRVDVENVLDEIFSSFCLGK
ncbi:tRNA uridine-5-carboxymethylaminomethyl(34) synthesis GTPase MnmE [Cochlodiniinecator piscidefendens]|uniref:tRNA uridine-5-carboxymethylaminomethyl(34) synthesis GTPase MnmE n=1 Tax=Cochlodiniinecator piscidefendens TaxID=2715756 RepID=UPI001407286B|nr:tRNA uridine-5-carboxymethylaminomethyl(34) synthesis GTPase MnmE [Cochlodiniinecator piscidefendens]